MTLFETSNFCHKQYLLDCYVLHNVMMWWQSTADSSKVTGDETDELRRSIWCKSVRGPCFACQSLSSWHCCASLVCVLVDNGTVLRWDWLVLFTTDAWLSMRPIEPIVSSINILWWGSSIEKKFKKKNIERKLKTIQWGQWTKFTTVWLFSVALFYTVGEGV